MRSILMAIFLVIPVLVSSLQEAFGDFFSCISTGWMPFLVPSRRQNI